MLNYFDYYDLDYKSLYRNAKKYKFINGLVEDEYFLGLDRARKKEYDIKPFKFLPNTHQKLSKEWIVQEIKNCKQDIHQFSQYIKIKDPTQSYIKFEPYLYQQQYYNTMLDSRYVISDKCRQIGFSVGTMVYILHLAMFKKDQSIDIISISDRESKDFLAKLKGIYEELDSWMLRVPLFQAVKDNEHELMLRNGSRIRSIPKTKEGARSGSLALLVFDEAAFIEYMANQWRGSFFAIAKSPFSKVLIISTRNGTVGTGEWYYNQLTATHNGETDFNLVEANWWEVPDYLIDPAWLDSAYKNTSRDTFLQEVCKKWLVAGDTVLDKEKLLHHKVIVPSSNKLPYLDDKTKTVKTKKIEEFHVFEEPKENVQYCITCDIGTGSAKSFSAFHVWDTDKNTQVAEYKKRINTNEFSRLLVQVAIYYNEAFIIPERNNPGEAVVSDLINTIGYKKVYKKSRRKFQYRDWGWSTTNKSRPLLINALIQDYEQDNIRINSKRTIDELLAFIWDEKTEKPKAAPGSTDDLTLALAIYCYLKEKIKHDLSVGASIIKSTGRERKKIWNFVYEDKVAQYFKDNYWLFSEKTCDKIKDNEEILKHFDKGFIDSVKKEKKKKVKPRKNIGGIITG